MYMKIKFETPERHIYAFDIYIACTLFWFSWLLQDMGSGNKEVDELKSTVADLKERLWQVRSERDELEAQYRQKEVSMTDHILVSLLVLRASYGCIMQQ